MAAVLASGCSSGSDSSAERFCDGFCAGMVRCGDWLGSKRECESDCVVRQTGLSDLSAGFTADYGECMGEAECSLLYAESTSEACWSEARANARPSSDVRAYCAHFAEQAFECGYTDTRSQCEVNHAIWADGVIDRLSGCVGAADCEQFFSCSDDVFEAL